jgi:hypothetical protein
MKLARTLVDTIHGYNCVLPAGLVVQVTFADNLPPNGPVVWWASPVPGGDEWPENTARWAADVGVGLGIGDVLSLGRHRLHVPRGDLGALCVARCAVSLLTHRPGSERPGLVASFQRRVKRRQRGTYERFTLDLPGHGLRFIGQCRGVAVES